MRRNSLKHSRSNNNTNASIWKEAVIRNFRITQRGDFDMKSGIVEYGNIIAIPPGETIKELLKNKEWTQAELARRTG